MKNKKSLKFKVERLKLKIGRAEGQSLIDVIFSIGIVILVLTGVVALVVNIAKVKRMTYERQKGVELSQLLIENKILESKNNLVAFWNGGYSDDSKPVTDFGDFSGYSYNIVADGCSSQKCNLIFNVQWADQSLSVERLFLRQGI
ncbi:MAG: hypothetical protein PHH12_00550 [Candidatus Shapirobacteria bacterium]|nr:hypothetical protein [Candidatus Shapirobacteria bacterium]